MVVSLYSKNFCYQGYNFLSINVASVAKVIGNLRYIGPKCYIFLHFNTISIDVRKNLSILINCNQSMFILVRWKINEITITVSHLRLDSMLQRKHEKLREFRWELLPHPSHSPGIAPQEDHLLRSTQYLFARRSWQWEDFVEAQQSCFKQEHHICYTEPLL